MKPVNIFLIKLIRFLLASVFLVIVIWWLYLLFRALELLYTGNNKLVSDSLITATYECLTFKLPKDYNI